MKQIRPVNAADPRDRIGDLQNGLELLLVRRVLPIGEADVPPYTDGLAHERAAGAYGDFTTKLVAIFQEQHAIPATGEVDDATAEALNAVLRQLGAFDDPEWVVRGQVIGAEGPFDGITVTAHDRDVFFGRDRPGSGQVLGRAVTGPRPDGHETGWFAIPYAADAFSPNDADAVPDLVLALSRDDEALTGARIFRLPDGDILAEETAVGPDELVLGFRPRRVETVRIEPAARPDERSEYERVWQAVEPLLPPDEEGRPREAYVAAQAADFDEDGHRDVTFVARETGLPREQVGAYAAAAALARTFRSDVPVAVLYGLHRVAGLTDLRLLAAAPLTTLDAALLRAADAGVIPHLEEGIRTAAVETIHRMGPALVLAEPTRPDGATLGRLLAPAIASTDDQADLLRLMTDHTGTATEFWTSLRHHETFGENAGAIRYAVELGTLTSDNAEVADAVRGLRPEAASLAQLAYHLTPDDLRGLLADPGIAVPDGTPGVDDAQRRRIYADATAGLLRNAHPSAVTARLVEGLAGDGDDAVVSPATARFLRRAVLEHEDFDLATTRLADLAGLVDGDETAAVLAQATRVQRLFRISTGAENLTGLLRSPYGSAHAITRAMTGPAFVRSHAAEMGGELEAALTYRRAMAVSALNLVLAVNGHQTAAADTPAGVSAGLSAPPTWAGFFGMSAGQHCEHCRSWLSPAAYLVDLLLFLDRRHGGPEGPTPLAALLARRPDLAHLQLSCENTDTALPYVDLVNEVLETYVAVGAVDASAAHDVTAETAAQLRARPQHVRGEAYTTLAQAHYPPTLPFDLWTELGRGYLDALGVARHELVTAFAGAYGDVAAEDTQRRLAAADVLGIGEGEYAIITGSTFAGVAVSVPTAELYGLTDAEFPAGVGAVPDLLTRTQLGFADLLTLLRCRYVNPAQDVADRIEAIIAGFGLTSAELRTVRATRRADAALTAKLARQRRTVTDLLVALDALDAEFPPDRLASLLVLHSAAGQDSDPATMALSHLDGSAATEAELRRVAIFLRLWRRLGWPMEQLDDVLAQSMTQAGDGVGAATIGVLADLERLRAATGTEVADLLALYRTDRPRGGVARVLGRRGADLAILQELAGIDPYAEPAATAALAALAGEVERSGFAASQLRYLYGIEPDGPGRVGLGAREITDAGQALHAGLAALAATYAVPGADEGVAAERVPQVLAEMLGAEQLTLAVALIEARPGSGPAPTEAGRRAARDDAAGTGGDPDGLATAFAEAAFPWPVPAEPLTDEARQTRRRAVLTAAGALLVRLRGPGVVTELLSGRFGLDTALTRVLLDGTASFHAGPPGGTPAMPTLLRLVADTPVDGLADLLGWLHRNALLATRLRLTPAELGPEVTTAATFGAWRNLMAYAALRDRITPGTPRLIDVLTAPADAAATLARATGWAVAEITADLAAIGADESALARFETVATLDRLRTLSRKLGPDPAALKVWALGPLDEERTGRIEDALRSRYDEAGWWEVARGVHDPLRERRRDALVAYVRTRPEIVSAGLRTPDALFGYFLIDVGMSACMLTSRIKQAISSVQLFVQRCLLNLEQPTVSPDAIDVKQWEWRKLYRVWEANRKVFLFPENYAVPELRDDKSPFFAELEAELLQSDVTPESVERALVGYVEKLDAVAHLEIVGFHVERTGRAEVQHVVGRTRAGAPRTYYYRRFADKEWSAWEPIGLDIQGVEKDDDSSESGVHLLPVVWRGHLYLFWPQFVKKAEKKAPLELKVSGTTITPPDEYWDVRLAWSRREQGRFAPKRLSSDVARIPRRKTWGLQGGTRIRGYDPPDLLLQTSEVNGALVVDVEGPPDTSRKTTVRLVRWLLPDPYAEPALAALFTAVPARPNAIRDLPLAGLLAVLEHPRRLVGGDMRYNRQRCAGGLRIGADDRNVASVSLLRRALGTFYVAPPGQTDLAPTASAVFAQDDFHAYLVGLTEGQPALPRAFDRHTLTGVGVLLASGAGLWTQPSVEAPRPPEPVVDPSPWRAAAVSLAPALVTEAAVAAGLRPAVVDSPSATAAGLAALDAAPGPAGRFTAVVGSLVDRIPGLGLLVPVQKTTYATFSTFFHPHARDFLQVLKSGGAAALLTMANQERVGEDFATLYDPSPVNVTGERPRHDVDFAPGGAYAIYNNELFFHARMLVATLLSTHQRYAAAVPWFPLDLTDNSPVTAGDPRPQRRFWTFKPLRDAVPENLEEMFARLTPGAPITKEVRAVLDQLEMMAAHPFQPHRIARLRPVAYQKYVAMRYLDNLIAWGDQLFGRDTIESINEATQYYVLAADFLGSQPEQVPAHRASAPVTFADVLDRLDEAGNLMAENEPALPIVAALAGTDGDGAIESLLGMGSSLYFCIPQNETILQYWEVVADRLFKIRHCLNIEGVERRLALFEPPIDPMLLVRAAAAGVDPGSVLSDLAGPLPRYRFPVMLAKAVEVCQEVKGLGSALLAALEKGDAEALALMRAQHEKALLTEVTQVRAWQVAEARAALAALSAAREVAVHRLEHYTRLRGAAASAVPAEPGRPDGPDADPAVAVTPVSDPAGTGRFVLTGGEQAAAAAGPFGGGTTAAVDDALRGSGAKMLSYERQHLVEAAQAGGLSRTASETERGAALMGIMPQFEIATKPTGTGSAVHFGSQQLAAPATAESRRYTGEAHSHGTQASVAEKLASVIWREQDHVYQCRSAALEIAQIDRQIIAAQIRLAVAEKEQVNHDRQVEQSGEVHDFLAGKVTNRELYSFLRTETAKLFFGAYQVAYDLAKQAERCYRFEVGGTATFIDFGYWDSLRQGLMSGERLGHALHRLERAHLTENRREYEITKHVSLLQLDPMQLLLLREQGWCEFEVPESAFDLDFPGHYFRRIKSVSVSLPCVAGPYTTVSGTLTLLNHRIRTRPTGASYAEQTDAADPRFVHDHIPMQSIATSSAQNDTGMFELNFRDERYLPFEGAGAVARWRFETPRKFRQIPPEAITDLVLTCRLTAREGGATLRELAVGALENRFKADDTGLVRMISMRGEAPGEWHRYRMSGAGGVVALPLTTDRFPYFATLSTLTVTGLQLVVIGGTLEDRAEIPVALIKKPLGAVAASVVLTRHADAPPTYAHPDAVAMVMRPRGPDDEFDELQVTLPPPGDTPPLDVMILCRYQVRSEPH